MSAVLLLRIGFAVVAVAVAKYFYMRATIEREPPMSHGSFRGDNTNICTICVDSFRNHKTITLPCKHKFHWDCVELLVTRGSSHSCPLCRQIFPGSIFTH